MLVTLNKNLIVYEENEEVILINMVKNNFYALDQMGSLIWRYLPEAKEVQDVSKYISQLFNETEERVQDDIVAFMKNLEVAGVIRLNGKY